MLTLTIKYCTREIVLQRSVDGNLGISIKGGLEHNLPILISRVSSTQESARFKFYSSIKKKTYVNNKYIETMEKLYILYIKH